jgi:hypothetical protein
MNVDNSRPQDDGRSLGLRAGDWVEVRASGEILATLDAHGCLDALPFMPEMAQYCGQRFRVFRSAHKACDTINKSGNRRMKDAVHLEGLRCDGQAHGGCQARCLLFWKEAWLKRAAGPESKERPAAAKAPGAHDLAVLSRATTLAEDPERYRCQATELARATSPLHWWQPGQYVKDLVSRNFRVRDLLVYGLIAAYNAVMGLHWRGRPYPHIRGLVEGKTPSADLKLKAGELVQVRSKQEIMATIGKKTSRNRGLWFDVEMLAFCGRNFRVLSRVDRLIDERTGKMLRPTDACIILEGVVCSGCMSGANRLFCPRAIYPYWHEVWLKRVE